MSKRTALVAVRPCGCATAFESSGVKSDVRRFYRVAADTDREVRRLPVEDAKALLRASLCGWTDAGCGGRCPTEEPKP